VRPGGGNGVMDKRSTIVSDNNTFQVTQDPGVDGCGGNWSVVRRNTWSGYFMDGQK
jgi:hypothetical protein